MLHLIDVGVLVYDTLHLLFTLGPSDKLVFLVPRFNIKNVLDVVLTILNLLGSTSFVLGDLYFLHFDFHSCVDCSNGNL